MTNNSNLLIIFARVPQAGSNKTRLIPAIGADKATQLYRHMAARTLDRARQLINDNTCSTIVHFTGGTIDEVQAEFGCDLKYCEQVGVMLGDRLKHAIRLAFNADAKKVLVIGTDCPSLTENDLQEAFRALDNHDVVIGPAFDGGYYLIGLRADHSQLFEGIRWSTSQVFEQTMEKAKALQLSVRVLKPLSDVDHPEDLLPLRCNSDVNSFPIATSAGRLSVIIPTLNEEPNLLATLQTVGSPQDDLEVIVVDAGSSDQTLAIAKQFGCLGFVGNSGRARQMNAGAAVASGEHLLFLHADTRLPANYRDEIRRILATSAMCGAFPLKIDAAGWALRIIEKGVAFRSTFFQMPYGDQALFFRSADFYEQGGFRQVAIMEDYEMIDRLRRSGKIGIASPPVTTSARRWLKKGILRTTIINQLCVAAYRLGFSDKTIANLYHGASKLWAAPAIITDENRNL